MNQHDESPAPAAQSQSQSQSPPPPSPSLAMDYSQKSPSAAPAPDPRPEQATSGFSTGSSNHSPSTKFKSKTSFSFQLPMKRISELLHDITGSMRQRFRLQKRTAQPLSQARLLAQDQNQTLSQDQDQAKAQTQNQDQDRAQPPSTSADNPQSPRMSTPRPVSSSSATSESRPLSIAPTQQTTTSSSATTLIGSPTASTPTTRVGSSSTWNASRAHIVSSASGATLRVSSAPEPARSKVATKGKDDGVWICCICRKWTLTSSPKCVKCRATGEKKPHPEFWPCFHIKCAACEELTEWGRKDYELTGAIGAGRIVGELVREAGVPGGDRESGGTEKPGGSGIGGWV
ncbi:hypothetical protein BKA61DRAFT_570300 [Leptodontidium sp. MPI-SDFR-AT-0119]|nr:hypothetical protein BKA61DRAFT_570300 [Leptodontidium sp. MPI-SDFR-AT-0119]